MVKNAPASAGDTGSILGQEHPLEKEMVTPSSILAWEIPWTEKPGALQSMRSQESDTTEATWYTEHALSVSSGASLSLTKEEEVGGLLLYQEQ